MATKQFVGRAAAVAQVVKIVYSSIVATNTYSVTINGKTVSVVATGTSLATLIDALIAAWAASAEPEHQELTAAQHLNASSVLDGLKLTANTAGVPHTVTAAATTGSATVTDDTAASGPNFWNVAANWSGAALPAGGDDLELIDSDVSILYGLTDTQNYGSLKIYASFTGEVGLPATNDLGYPEYRTRRLTLGDGSGTIAVTIGQGEGSHSSGIRLNMNDNVTTLQLLDGQASNNGYAVEMFDMDATSTATIYGGQLLIDDSHDWNRGNVKVMARDDARTKPDVATTSRITATTVNVFGAGAFVELNGNSTTLVARDYAEVRVNSAAAIANVTASSFAKIDWRSSGGIGTGLTVQADGTVSFANSVATKTIAAATLYAGGTLLDPYSVVTWTAGVVLSGGAKLADVVLDLGVGRTITV